MLVERAAHLIKELPCCLLRFFRTSGTFSGAFFGVFKDGLSLCPWVVAGCFLRGSTVSSMGYGTRVRQAIEVLRGVMHWPLVPVVGVR
jgi:hypothetical protein